MTPEKLFGRYLEFKRLRKSDAEGLELKPGQNPTLMRPSTPDERSFQKFLEKHEKQVTNPDEIPHFLDKYELAQSTDEFGSKVALLMDGDWAYLIDKAEPRHYYEIPMSETWEPKEQ